MLSTPWSSDKGHMEAHMSNTQDCTWNMVDKDINGILKFQFCILVLS